MIALLEPRCVGEDLRGFRRKDFILCDDIHEIGHRAAHVEGGKTGGERSSEGHGGIANDELEWFHLFL